jgi:putative DNA primase/helicase
MLPRHILCGGGMATNPRKSRAFPLTDSGNAELIAELFGDRLRFDHCRNTWLLWKGNRWAEDSDGEVFRMAKEAARARLKAGASVRIDTRRQDAVQWALKSESQYHLKAALELAKITVPIADPGENWDSDPLLLSVCNGVVDLRTGERRPARPEDRIRLQTTAAYEPSAHCPRFLQFLREVFLGNDETIRYVQKAVGYSLTGDVREQCLFLCYGEGANGKSTFLETVRNLLGSYAHNLPFSAFELSARSGISNDIASIVSKRFVTAVETNENLQFNEGRVKALTGGDQSTARFLYHEFFSFDPTAKFWLAFNHKPRVTDDSHGFWRRVRLVPFLARFDGADDDKSLGDKLRAEAAGILTWAVQGCRLWLTEGLGIPPAVREATALYRTENDSVAMFLDDCYDLGQGGVVTCAELARDYGTWAKENGETMLHPRALASRLRAHGLEGTRTGSARERKRAWNGLKRKGSISNDFRVDARTDVDTRIQ